MIANFLVGEIVQVGSKRCVVDGHRRLVIYAAIKDGEYVRDETPSLILSWESPEALETWTKELRERAAVEILREGRERRGEPLPTYDDEGTVNLSEEAERKPARMRGIRPARPPMELPADGDSDPDLHGA